MEVWADSMEEQLEKVRGPTGTSFCDLLFSSFLVILLLFYLSLFSLLEGWTPYVDPTGRAGGLDADGTRRMLRFFDCFIFFLATRLKSTSFIFCLFFFFNHSFILSGGWVY